MDVDYKVIVMVNGHHFTIDDQFVLVTDHAGVKWLEFTSSDMQVRVNPWHIASWLPRATSEERE